MKVEIELQELDRIREERNNYMKEADDLRKKLTDLDEKKLIARAEQLSYYLFDCYMEAVFRELGATHHWEAGSVVFTGDIRSRFQKDWWNCERLKVDVGAQIIGEFWAAFLRIGVNLDVKPEKDKYEHKL